MSQLKSFRDLKVYQKLKALHLEVHSLSEWAGTTRTGNVVREERATYGTEPAEPPWSDAVSISGKVEEMSPWIP